TLLPADELERPRLRRVSAQQPGALEIREVCVDGGGRGETDSLADLPHRGRISVTIDIGDEEAPDLALPAGQLGCGLHLTLRGRGRWRTGVRQQGTDSSGRRQSDRLRIAYRIDQASSSNITGVPVTNVIARKLSSDPWSRSASRRALRARK